MRKILIIILLLLISISGYLTFNSGKKEIISDKTISQNIINKDIKKIALVSDFHLQLDNLSNPINGVIKYGSIIIDAILDEISSSDIDLLVLVGDNTNSGKIDQHNELIKKLDKYKSNFEILVTIGNHDMGRLDIKKYSELYKDFGFSSYYSKDNTSLSYSTIYNDLMVIILDTGGYSDSGVNPNVSDKTLSWLKDELEFSKENNLKVICVGHYPLITAQSGEFKQKDTIKNLLVKYDVPLYISGHLHGHSVNIDNGLYELVVEQSTSYPVSYELIDIKEDSIKISKKICDIQKYARDNNLKDNNLLEFNSLLESSFKDKSDEIVDLLSKDKDISYEDLSLAKDMFYMLMRQRSIGDLIDYIDIINNHPGKDIFLNIAEGTIWARWLPSVLNEANEYTKGFSIKFN